HQDDIKLFESYFTQSLGSPEKVTGPVEIRLVGKDGKFRWFQAMFTNLLHLPEVAGMVFHLHNIDSQKEAEKTNLMTSRALENERGRFYELLSHAPAGMGILNGPEHVFQMINPFYFEMIGRKDVIGLALAAALPHLEEQGVIAKFDEVYRTGVTLKGNEALATVSDQETGLPRDIYINYIFQPYRNPEGDIEGSFFFINDVTEQVMVRK